MTEQLPFHFSLLCIGEGDGNPLQCSCLENPGDGRAWWAAISGVAQIQTRLGRLSSSSSKDSMLLKFYHIYIYISFMVNLKILYTFSKKYLESVLVQNYSHTHTYCYSVLGTFLSILSCVI